MNDLISRQAVIDALYDWSNHSMTDAETWHIRQVIGDIKSMPTVQQWIPCNERLPDKDGDYLITYDESYANDYDYDRLVSIAPFEVASEAFGYWHQCLGTNGWLGEDWISIPVVAWMPLPPSYRGDSE